MSKIRFVLRGAWQDCILKLRSFRYISAFVMVLGLAAASRYFRYRSTG